MDPAASLEFRALRYYSKFKLVAKNAEREPRLFVDNYLF